MDEDLPDLVRAADRGGALAPHDHDAGPGQNLRIVECKYMYVEMTKIFSKLYLHVHGRVEDQRLLNTWGTLIAHVRSPAG